jgi:hypothetical protein
MTVTALCTRLRDWRAELRFRIAFVGGCRFRIGRLGDKPVEVILWVFLVRFGTIIAACEVNWTWPRGSTPWSNLVDGKYTSSLIDRSSPLCDNLTVDKKPICMGMIMLDRDKADKFWSSSASTRPWLLKHVDTIFCFQFNSIMMEKEGHSSQ